MGVGESIIETKEQPVLSVRAKVKVSEIANAMGGAFGEVAQYMGMNRIQMAGPPFAYYHSWSNEEVEMDCGFPVIAPANGSGRVQPFTLPAVRAVTAMHTGPYDQLMVTYSDVEKWAKAHGHELANNMWEYYLNNPGEVAPDKLMTQIFWPIK